MAARLRRSDRLHTERSAAYVAALDTLRSIDEFIGRVKVALRAAKGATTWEEIDVHVGSIEKQFEDLDSDSLSLTSDGITRVELFGDARTANRFKSWRTDIEAYTRHLDWIVGHTVHRDNATIELWRSEIDKSLALIETIDLECSKLVKDLRRDVRR